jgi:2-polyprenyl-6-methoxyphenol hydroxylase-like FAD-dependent oxidoreductase
LRHPHNPSIVDAVIVGGGPAGAAVGRMLAQRGHSVLLLTKAAEPTRGLAETLPPSSRKVMAAVGMLDAIAAGAFPPTRGNTVWWGDREGQVQPFAPHGAATGLQVFRPDFDRVLLRAAASGGAVVCNDATVTRVRLDDDSAVVEYERGGTSQRVRCAFAIDCSGRSGVIARQGFRRHDPRFRMQALIGVWRRDDPWDVVDESHTIVETFHNGWAWSVPLPDNVRQVVAMVDGPASFLHRGATLRETYLAAVEKAGQLGRMCRGASLTQVWACDASLYSASTYAGRNFLLVGDAASTIDPLSSFGVKKAFASAWLAATAVHTMLGHPDRRDLALTLFADRERQMYTSYLRHSSEYAREAVARYSTSFWAARANVHADGPDIRAAFDRLKAAGDATLHIARPWPLVTYGVVQADAIVPGLAVALGDGAAPVRFVAGVDLIELLQLAADARDVAGIFDACARHYPRLPLPNVLTALSILVAHNVLVADAPDTFVAAIPV